MSPLSLCSEQPVHSWREAVLLHAPGGCGSGGSGLLTLGARSPSPGDGGVGEAQLPFAECHPPVIDADGAVAEPGHNEGAMGVAGEARHAAVGARGDVLGPTQTRQAPWGQGPTLASCPRSWAQRQAGSICPSYSPGPRPAAQRTQPQTPP